VDLPMTANPINVETNTEHTSSASAGVVVWALCQRELLRFFRQRNRVIGALGQPLLFWGLFAAGFGPSFQITSAAGARTYGEFFFPGTVVLIVLFTAIFATISI